MALLRFVVSAVAGSGLLLVATYRDVAVADRALLASTLGALAREPVVERLLLPALDRDEGALLVGRLLGRSPGAGLVTDILERSRGNPLFLTHLVRLLQGGEKAAGNPRLIVREQVPPAVIDLIRLRVDEQPEATRRLLDVAAVVGRSFELDLLVQVELQSFDAAPAGLEPAILAGLVVEEDVPGAYRFTHALMREAIVAGMGRTRTGRLHGAIGDALAARGPTPRASLPSPTTTGRPHGSAGPTSRWRPPPQRRPPPWPGSPTRTRSATSTTPCSSSRADRPATPATGPSWPCACSWRRT